VKRFFQDNGLSIAFWALFAVCLCGQAILGHRLAGDGMIASGPASDGLLRYVGGADFQKGVFGNWQAALLQLFTLVVFAVFLRQRGAPHSRQPVGEASASAGKHRGNASRTGSFLQRNSLSLILLTLFALSFLAFFLADYSVDTAERLQKRLAHLTAPEFLISARFWFDVLQTWQAEFFAMGAFLLLSIFCRQSGSAYSKPDDATNDDTGETNK
jgi:hypothetical protein